MPGNRTFFPDMRQNLRILLNRQHLCGRFRHARERVGELLDSFVPSGGGGGTVWLAGHSLGASIALDLRAFLFNPPHPSPLSLLIGKAAKRVYTGSYYAKHLLGKARTQHNGGTVREATALAAVSVHAREGPHLQGLHRLLRAAGARLPDMATSAATLSYRDMWHSLFGKHKERPHLIPSAVLWKNQSKDGDAHGLQQWWQPTAKLVLSHNLYTWP
ncbi:unnamed protein product [Urochloa decumbens]|uniref:Fungal lipase-like domain-containing protein n=1 Tax=Urochloa decumbens TaxID=240449 RepID=A0ABC9FBP3_9POAL